MPTKGPQPIAHLHSIAMGQCKMVDLKGIAGLGFLGSREKVRCALGLTGIVETIMTCCWRCFVSREAAMHAADHCNYHSVSFADLLCTFHSVSFLFGFLCCCGFCLCISRQPMERGRGCNRYQMFRWNMFWLEAMHVPFDGLSMMSCLQQGYE